jgi:hypothetical protein
VVLHVAKISILHFQPSETFIFRLFSALFSSTYRQDTYVATLEAPLLGQLWLSDVDTWQCLVA